jgi:N-acetylneuraminate lyase
VKLDGAITALVTPYDEAGCVAEEMLRRLAERHISLGVNGLYLCGGAGEGMLLSTEERKHVAEVVIDQARRRVPVVVHVGSIRTQEAAELARHAQGAGADGVASVPPFYYPASTEAIYRYYARIAECCTLPLFLYNIPSMVGLTVTPEMMSAFMQIPSVVGMKFSSYNLFQMRQILELEGGRLTVLSGNDEVFLAALAMGAHGSIGLTHNFMPKLYLEIYRNFRAGCWDRARELQYFGDRVVSALLKHPAIGATKTILRLKGYDCGRCRGPLENLIDAQEQALFEDFTALRFFDSEFGI